jgi:hypothetical protein
MASLVLKTAREILANVEDDTNDAIRVNAVVNPILGAGSSLIGRVALDPQTANGLSIYRRISTASNNSVNVKSSAGLLYGIVAFNINASVRYLKIYDKATAPTVGTDTPVLTIGLTGGAACTVVSFLGEIGLTFVNGIGIGIVTGIGDSDNTSTAANEQIVHLFYK